MAEQAIVETSGWVMLREIVQLVGALIGIAAAFALWGPPMWASFWPIRIVALEKARATSHPKLENAAIQEISFSVRVETLKRTSGPITRLRAYVEGVRKMNLIESYNQPPVGIDEQILTFGYLPDGPIKVKTWLLLLNAGCERVSSPLRGECLFNRLN